MNGMPLPPPPRLAPSASDFADRVMASVAGQPRPTPARVFVRSVLRFRLRDAWAALATAGRLAFGPAGPIPTLVRVQSLLLLLVFTTLVSSGGAIAAAGAIRVIETQSHSPRVEQRLVVPPAGSSASPRWSPGPIASPSPVPLRDPAGTPRAVQRAGPPASKEGAGSGGTQSQNGKVGEPASEPRGSKGKPSQPSDGTSGNGSKSDDAASDGGRKPTSRTSEPSSNDGATRARDRGTGSDRDS